MFDLVRELLAPSKPKSIFRQDVAGRSNVKRVLAGVVIFFVVTALLSSNRLVAMAERMEYGDSRDRWLGAAETLDDVSGALRLDRPAQAVDEALGRSVTESTVVVGELAMATVPLTSSTTLPLTTTDPSMTAPQASAAPQPSTVERQTTTTLAPTTAAPTTTTTIPVFGTANINEPLRIWAGGDSLGEYIGSRLEYKVADESMTDVELDYEISTGLARPDYFDWPARVSEIMQRDAGSRPQVVLFMVGGNDDQDMRAGDDRLPFFDANWLTEYRRRVALMMDTTAYPGTQMIWVSLPPMRDERRDQMVEPINIILREEAAIRPWVEVADIASMFRGRDGGYEQFLADPSSDKTVRARANDGVHITSAASEWVSRLVWELITRSWEFDADVVPTTTTSSTTDPGIEPTPPVDQQPGGESTTDTTVGDDR